MCLTLLKDVIIIDVIIIIINNNTSVLKYWFLTELINRILYSGTSPLGHLYPFRGHKILQRTKFNIP